jgi:ribosomal protein S18 acetylase RimI-like enzyme
VGVASSLVAAALTTRGAARVAVHVELANEGAAALYERLLGPAKAVETAAAARAAGRPRRALHWVDV